MRGRAVQDGEMRMSWRKQRRAMDAKVQAAEEEARQLRARLEAAEKCVTEAGERSG